MNNSHKTVETAGISAEQSAEISLVPLVDLCLTLVVVFLILTPMSLNSLLPISASSASGGAQSEAPQKQEVPLLVNLSADQVRVGSVVLSSDLQNAAWFRDAFGSRHNHEIILQTASEVPQDRLVHWLDDLRTTGDWTVTLVVPQGAAKP